LSGRSTSLPLRNKAPAQVAGDLGDGLGTPDPGSYTPVPGDPQISSIARWARELRGDVR